MNHNFTRTSSPTPKELAAREQWYAEQMANAAKVNEQFMLAQQQIESARFEEKLIEKTQLSVEQLIALREWLRNNPRPEADHNEKIR